MLEPVIAMYSVPSSPLYREVGSGMLTQDSLKAVGVFAQRVSKVGWLTILSKSGDKKSQIEAIHQLMPKYGALVASVGLFSVIPKICDKCKGTGTYKWKSGNIKECKSCTDGRVIADHKYICSELGIEVDSVNECIDFLLKEESLSIDEIKRKLKKERSADG